MKRLLILLLIHSSLMAIAQDTMLMDERGYLKAVWSSSPLVRSQQLNIDLAQTAVMDARSPFEPKLNGSFVQKSYDSTMYYNRIDGGVSIQSPFGLKFSTGYQNADGIYLNPEYTLPQQGLRYTGIEIPLGAGLFTDKYRTDLKLARYGLSATEIEVHLNLNKLLLEAGIAYWKWFESVYLLDLAKEAMATAKDRLDFVKSKYQIGEYPAIDTLEAFINYQHRQSFYNEQLILLKQNKMKLLSVMGFMGDTAFMPLADLNVENTNIDTVWNRDLILTHPMLELFDLSTMSNQAKKNLAQEYFKPQLDLKYAMLTDMNSSFLGGSVDNNYVGVQLNFPMALRSERSKVKRFELQNEMIAYERQYFEIDLENKILANIQMRSTLDSNRRLLALATVNYRTLLEAEQQRFIIGESNNFLLNRRELQWLSARKSFVKSYVDFRIQQLEYLYLLAVLPNLVSS